MAASSTRLFLMVRSCACRVFFLITRGFFAVDGGHRAVIFDRFTGVKKNVEGEGTHFFIPWVQRPIIFDVRSRPRNVPVITGSKGKETLLWFNSNAGKGLFCHCNRTESYEGRVRYGTNNPN